MSVKYSAIAAKLRAMHSKFITEHDYEELLSKKSVNDICAYLKATEGYNDVLGGVDEHNIHRGEMELLIEQDIVNEYVRIYNFIDKSGRALLDFWFMGYEIEFLKREIRHIYTHETRSDDDISRSKFNAFFETHTKIDREIMRGASSLADCIEACRETPYADVLQRAQNLEADFFSIGMMLDAFYYMLFWRTINHHLDKTQSEYARKLIGSKIDMLNLLWIYRGKRYFDFESEIIFTYLLAGRYRLSQENIRQLVGAKDVEEFIYLVGELTPYGELFENYDRGTFPEENYNHIYNRLSKQIFVTQSESVVAVYAYLNLKEVELNNITTIIEGIRYGLNPESIRTHIGLAQRR